MYNVKNISHPPDNQDKAHGRVRLTREELCSGKPGEEGRISLHFDCNLDKGTRYLKSTRRNGNFQMKPRAIKAATFNQVSSAPSAGGTW